MFFKRCFNFVCVCLCLPPLIQLLEVGFSNLWLLSSWRHTLTSLTSPELSPESSATIRRKCCSRKSGTGWDSNHVAPDFRPCPSYLSVPLPKRFQFVKMCCSFFFFFFFFFLKMFGLDLQISDKVFVMDAGASNSRDVKLLRSHLQELRANIISVSTADK